MKKITIATLQKDIEQLNKNLSDKNQIINDICDKLDISCYSTKSEILSSISEFKGAAGVYRQIIKEREGTISRIVEELREENSKLWYFMRIALKDESAQKTAFKPGDRKRIDEPFDNIIRPFRN